MIYKNNYYHTHKKIVAQQLKIIDDCWMTVLDVLCMHL